MSVGRLVGGESSLAVGSCLQVCRKGGLAPLLSLLPGLAAYTETYGNEVVGGGGGGGRERETWTYRPFVIRVGAVV